MILKLENIKNNTLKYIELEKFSMTLEEDIQNLVYKI